MTNSRCTAIVRRASVEEMVGFRNAAVDQYRVMIAATAQLNTTWNRATGSTFGTPGDFIVRRDSEAAFTRRLDQSCWRRVVMMTELEKLMDHKTRQDFEQQLEKAPPDFTVDNVLATLTDLIGRADEIFNRSVIATFEALPRAYRSNDGFKYGKRIIFEGCSDPRWAWWFYSHTYAAQRLQDLDRVFSALDTKAHDGTLDACDAVRTACQNKKQWETTSRYFELRGYAKGSLHVKPLRRDLIDAANRILAAHYGASLPDARVAA